MPLVQVLQQLPSQNPGIFWALIGFSAFWAVVLGTILFLLIRSRANSQGSPKLKRGRPALPGDPGGADESLARKSRVEPAQSDGLASADNPEPESEEQTGGVGAVEAVEEVPLSRAAPESVVSNFLERFALRLEQKVHPTVESSEALLGDVMGGMAWNRSPSVFFKAGYMFRQELYDEADALMPDLFRTWIRSEVKALSPSATAALVNYAVWRGHFAWIVEIAERAPSRETLSLAAAALAQTNDRAMAHYFLHRSADPSPAAAECVQATAENRRVMLPYVLLPSAGAREKAARVSHLLSGGRIFRAVSFLRRLAMSELWAREWLVRVLLNNGRYFQAVKLLEGSQAMPTRDSWFELAGAVAMLGGDLKALSEVDSEGRRNFPDQQDRARFVQELEEVTTNEAVAPGGGWDNVARDVLIRAKLEFLAAASGPSYAVEVLLEIGLSYERLDRLLRGVWGAVVASAVISDADLVVLAGGNLAARLVLALRLFQAGSPSRALTLLMRAGRHPVAEHLRAEILTAAGRWDEALAVYERLIKREPDDAVIRRNYSRLLEKMSRWDDAEEQLFKAGGSTAPGAGRPASA